MVLIEKEKSDKFIAITFVFKIDEKSENVNLLSTLQYISPINLQYYLKSKLNFINY